MKNKFILILFMSFLIINISNAQNKAITKSKSLPNSNTTKYYKTQHKSMEYAGGWAEFDFLVNNPNEKEYSDDVKYYWYNDNLGINVTKGGSGGKLIDGVFQSYYSDGKLKAEINFHLGQKDGYEKQWDSLGELISTYKYFNNKIIYSKFIESENDVINEWIGVPYSKGSVLNLYNRGVLANIKSKREYLNGLLYVKYTNYFYNGKVDKVYYKKFNNFLDSNYVEYYNNGQLRVNGKYDDNWRVGDWIYYNNDGSRNAIEKYRVIRQYYDKNDLKLIYGEFYNFKYKTWELHGIKRYYSDEKDALGRKIIEKKYYNGIEVDLDYDLGD
jgi:antitoxin component YwqK of YwqJK toxin-antitoxin module